MCLTIPKKVVSLDNGKVIVSSPDGTRQEVKTIVELAVGDFVLTHQNIAVEKIEPVDANLMLREIEAISKGKEGK